MEISPGGVAAAGMCGCVLDNKPLRRKGDIRTGKKLGMVVCLWLVWEEGERRGSDRKTK